MIPAIRFISILVFFSLSFSVFGQELCNNGTDDDGDGFIDCNDVDCQYGAAIERGCNCKDGIDNDGDGKIDNADGDCASFFGVTFVGDDSDCSVPPDPNASTGVFDFVGPPATSGQNTVDTQSKIAIGDMNCDGIPDVVTTSKWNQSWRIVATSDDQPDGSDRGDVIQDYKTPGSPIFPKGNWYPEQEILIADIDGICPPEIFGIASKRVNANSQPTEFVLVGFRARPSPSNKELIPLFDAIPLGPNRPGSIGIADFDCNGTAEIFLKDQIYSASTGELLLDGDIGDWDTEVNGGPVVADIIPGGNLEMVVGNQLWSIPDLADGVTQTPTLIADMNDIDATQQWFPKEIFDNKEYGFDNFSSTSIADVNNDGNLDIVLSGALNSSTGATAVFFWDITNNTVDHYLPQDPNYANGWPWGTSRVNLGDIDGDGKLELTFVAGDQLIALEEVNGELVEKWTKTINDSLSGIISTTVYDFDNDGNPELVYRDSQELVVLDGSDPTNVLWSVTCYSHTFTEGPVIADVDGDSNTDLCVPCNTTNTFDINDPIQQQALGELRCFFSSDNGWLPTRQVWNQQGYAVANIADDLSVPCPAIDMTAVFGTGDCPNGLPGPQTPLNTFMNQVPTVGADGCPFYPAPDISFVGNDPTLEPGDPGYVDPSDPNYFPAVQVIPPICGDLGIEVAFNIINDGDLAITDDLDVSFWEGNPTLAIDTLTGEAATLLHTSVLNLTGLDVGDTLSQGGILFDYSGEVSTLYIVLNDDGTEFPVDLDDNEFSECKIDNNIFAFPITPDPFTVTIEKISDNENCDAGVSGVETGELRAVVSKNGVELVDLSPFAFQWYDGSDETAPLLPNSQGGQSDRATELGNGDYTLIVTNSDKGCASAPVTETIIQLAATPVATIQVNSDQTICLPPNGELEVIMSDYSGVTFDWRDQFGTPLGITGPIASDLDEGSYAVIVTRNGCPLQLDANIQGPLVPDIAASVTQHVISCGNTASGEVTSSVTLAGAPQNASDYTFNWYFYNNATSTVGSSLPPVNGTGPSRTGLEAGFYAVFATQNSTNCTTTFPAIVEILDSRVYPEAVVIEVAPQTSCDPTQPNGILGVEINYPGGGLEDPNNFTIRWYRGQNTLAANEHFDISADGSQAFGISGDGVPYTAQVVDANGCDVTAFLAVTQTLINPVVTLTRLTNNSICDETIAGTTFNGSIEVSVEYDGVVVTLPAPNYEVTWYDGGSLASPIHSVGTTSTLTGLPGGQQYGVRVTRTDLFCPSNFDVVNVLNDEVLPIANEVITHNTLCSDPGNGIIDVQSISLDAATIVRASYAGRFDINLYEGNGTGGAPVVDSGTIGEFTGLGGDGGNEVYTIEVIDFQTGCTRTEVVTVEDQSVTPILVFDSQTPNGICDITLVDAAQNPTGFNGSVTVGQTAGLGTPVSYTWVYDVAGPHAPQADVVTAVPTLTNAPDGNYTVTMVDDLGCSTTVNVTIQFDQVLPIANEVITHNTLCADPGNGIIDVQSINLDAATILRASYAGRFDINLYEGNGTGGTPVADTGTIGEYTDLGGDGGNEDFTIEIIDLQTGCSSTEVVTVEDQSVTPILVFDSQTPNGICDITLVDAAQNPTGFNGGVTVAQIAGIGTPVSYTWVYDVAGPHAPQADVVTAVPSLTNAPDGDYTVTMVDDLGCSVSLNVTIQFDQILPIANEVITHNTLCADPGNGIIDVQSINLDAATILRASYAGRFDINLYEGNGTGGAPVADTGTIGEFIDLGGDGGNEDYTIEIIDLLTGCSSTEVVTVEDQSVTPVLVFDSQTPNGICDISLVDAAQNPTGFNGSVTVAQTAGVGTPVSYTWVYDATSPHAPQADVVTAVPTLTNAPDGNYTVTMVDDLGCSTSLNVTIQFDQVLPIANEVITHNTLCADPGNGIIDVQSINLDAATILRASYAGRFDINLYEGNGTGGAPVADTGTAGEFTGLGSDSGDEVYTIEIIDLQTGCSNTEVVTVEDNSTNPVIAEDSKQNNSICDVNLGYNGFVVATYTDPNDLGLTDTYEILWEVEQNPGTNDWLDITDPAFAAIYPDAAINNGAGTTTLDFIDGGSYRVTVTNLTTGCPGSPIEITIINDPVLPTPSVTNNVDQTSCDVANPNGTLSVDGDGAGTVAGYTYEWFIGAGVGGTQITDDPAALIYAWDETNTPETISNLPLGNYTVIVTDITSGCTQVLTDFVDETITLPVVTLTPSPNTACDPTLATGTLEVEVDDGGVVDMGVDGADYQIFLYNGQNTSSVITNINGADFGVVAGTSLNGGNAVFESLTDQYYTVVVRNLVTSCASQDVNDEVDDSTVDPTLTTAFVEQTSCDYGGTPNGEVSVTVNTPSPGLFDIQWYTGNSITSGNELGSLNEDVADGVGATITVGDLPSDNYTVWVYDIASGCDFQETIFVPQNIVDPVFSLTPADHTDCTFDGNITPALVQGANVDYEFAWYEGETSDLTGASVPFYTSGPVLVGSGDEILNQTNKGTLNNLYSGFYTVIITDNSNFCDSDTLTSFINPAPPQLNVKFFEVNLPSDCADATGVLTAYVDVNNDGNIDANEINYTNYTFTWFVGLASDPDPNFFENSIDSYFNNPAITVDVNDRYNVGPVPGGVKDVNYFEQEDATHGATIYEQLSTTYTLVVEDHTGSGCTEMFTYFLPFVDAQVTTFISKHDDTDCDPAVGNGDITVIVNESDGSIANQALYEVLLFDVPNPDITTDPANPAPAADQIIQRSGYTSDFSSDVDGWDGALSKVDLEFAQSIGGFNDVLKIYGLGIGNNHLVTLDHVVSGHSITITFDYYIPSTNTSVDGFSLSVNGSAATNIRSDLGTAVYDAWTPVTKTFNATGAFEQFRLFDGNTSSFNTTSDPNDDMIYIKDYIVVDNTIPTTTFTNLGPGDYAIVSQQTFGSNCFSELLQVTIEDAARPPVLTPTISANTWCDTSGTVTPQVGDGSITVTPSIDPIDIASDPPNTEPDPRNYSYEWYQGSGTGGTLFSVGNNVGLGDYDNSGEPTTSTISELAPGFYTVVVTDDDTGCSNQKTYEVTDQDVPPTLLDATPTASTNCDPVNGQLLITDADVTPGIVDDYYFKLYFEGTTDADLVAEASVVGGEIVAAAGSFSFTDLAPGTYFITDSLLNSSFPGFGCISNTISRVIDDNSVDPDFELSVVQPNTACAPAGVTDYSGVILVDNFTTAGAYTIEWFDGTDTSTPFVDGTNGTLDTNTEPDDQLINVGEGLTTNNSYTVRVTDAAGCFREKTIQLIDEPSNPTVSATANSITNCFPFNGEITITGVTIDAAPGNIDDFNFDLYDNTDAIIDFDDDGAGGAIFTGLDDGSYYIIATKARGAGGIGCETGVEPAVIEDQRVYPIMDYTTADDQACDFNAATGEIDIEITNLPGTYDYVWSYNDPSGTLTAAIVFADAVSWAGDADADPNTATLAGLTENPAAITGLAAGEYTVVATNTVTGCDVMRTITLNDDPVIPQAVDALITPSDPDDCPPDNGTITVADGAVTVGPDPIDVDELTVELYNDSDVSNVANRIGVDPGTSGTKVFTGLSVGTYYVRIVVNANLANPNVGVGCEIPPYRVDLEDKSVDPTIDVTTTASQSCTGPGTGTITLVFDATKGVKATDYTIDWTTDPSGMLVDDPASSDTPATFTDLPAGTYEVTITDNDHGCTISTTITIDDDPVIPQAVDALITPSDPDDCPPDNGTITVADGAVTVGTDPIDVDELTVELYNDSDVSNVANRIGVDPGTSGTKVFTDLTNGTYYVKIVVNANLANPNVGVGCEIPPYRVDLEDKSVDPTIDVTTTASQSCTGLGTGTITLVFDATKGVKATDYTIDWTTDPSGTLVDDPASSDTPATFTDLPAGTYEVTITDNDHGCTISTTITIDDDPVIPQAIDALITPSDPDDCPPDNGTITVADGAVTVGPDPIDVDELTVELYNDSDVSNVANRIGVDPGTSGTKVFTDLTNGTYYVKIVVNANLANPNVGVGCEIPPYRVDLEDKSVDPTIDVATTASQSCTGPGTGTITLVFDATKGVKATDYTIDWTTDPSGTLVDDPASSDTPATFTDLPAGTYEVTITDNDHGCTISTTITIDDDPVIPQAVDALITPSDPDDCPPDNGTITVADGAVTVGPDPIDVDELTVELYNDSDVSNVANRIAVDPGTSGTKVFTGLTNGTYYVKIVIVANLANPNVGVGCEIPPYRVDLEDKSVDPILTFDVPEPDVTCMDPQDPPVGNGSVIVNSTDDNGDPLQIVTWDWFERDLDGDGLFNNSAFDAVPASAAENNTLFSAEYTGLPAGIYRLMATDTKGCATIIEVEIEKDEVSGTPNIVDIVPVLPTGCNAADGSLQVTSITIGTSTTIGLPDVADPLQFTYQWYLNDYPGNPLAGETFNEINGLEIGTYYVEVTNISTGCPSPPREFIVDESEVIFPDLSVAETVPQLSCEAPYTGELTATVDASGPTGPYTFEWFYEGSTTLPTNLVTGNPVTPVTAGNISVLDSLPVGRYDVIVTNTATGCTETALYIIENESENFIPVINTGTEPVTSCDSDNGGIFGRAVSFRDANNVDIYPLPNYDYRIDIFDSIQTSHPRINDVTWLDGDADYDALIRTFEDNVNADQRVYVGNVVTGPYTIRVIDNNTRCVSVKVDVVVADPTFPEVEILLENPLISCDPASPDGQLQAIVNGRNSVSGFSFEWYEGNTASGTIIHDRNRLIGVDAGVYTVRVINNVSGCFTDASGEVTSDQLLAPTPTPELISDRYSCIIEDGELTVSVNGETGQYSFEWFVGADGTGTSIGSNPRIINLPEGTYSVRAYDNVTGCSSLPVSIDIADLREDPEFIFETEGSKCDEPTGMARVVVTNNVNVASINWTDLTTGAGLGLGQQINDVESGDYNALVTTVYGCENEGVATVGTVITNYNLVTSDGDGFNDNFQIDCITRYPDNNVKIYNRAGVLVYEIDGYNNADKSFQGLGEKGAYAIGNDLPNGTYFYVIDKGDGSKLISGFLELIR